MAQLTGERCIACNRNSPRLTDAELTELQPQIAGWSVIERDGVQQLERVFTVPNFAAALALTNKIGILAEEEGHHPAILTEWGRVTVRWWTHKIKGLHRNDVIMAAKTDQQATEPADVAIDQTETSISTRH